MRQRLNEQLAQIHEKLIRMSVLVEESVGLSIKALVSGDDNLVRQVIELDNRIDQHEKEIEDQCIELIATQSPMAGDLRRIFTILKLITDLERIGDHSENIAKVVRRFKGKELIKPLIDIPKMATLARQMISQSIRAYIGGDTALAVETAKMDDEVDRLYKEIYSELLDLIGAHGEDESYKDQVIGFLLIGRYLERIADHSTNICERVVYMITGNRMVY